MQVVLHARSTTDAAPAEARPLAPKPRPMARNAASDVGETPAATSDILSHATSSANTTDSDGRLKVVYYHRQSELETRAAMLGSIDPSTRSPDEAYVVLRIRIDERGNVDDVRSMVSDSAVAERNAIDAFGTARFLPGTIRGMPVKSELWIELKFRAIDPLALAASRMNTASTTAPDDALAHPDRQEP